MIDLQLIHGKILVWKASDVRHLREKNRVIGVLTGSLPNSTHQNNELGLPLMLMKEEAHLLCEEGLAQMVVFNDEKSDSEVKKKCYEESDEEWKREYIEKYKRDRKETVIRMSDKIVEGKLKKLKVDKSEDELKGFKDKIIEEELAKIVDVKPEAYPVRIPTACPLPDEYRMKQIIDSSCDCSCEELVRCLVFKDLWRNHYYITDGFKFGCDFLAYEDDPVVCHSRYMVVCISRTSPIHDLKLQTLGRLARTVKKIVLIAVLDEKEDEDGWSIRYLSLKDYNNL